MFSVTCYAAQTLLGLRLTQVGGAATCSMAAVSAVPLAQLLFTSNAVMTDIGAEQCKPGNTVALGLCLGGFAIHFQGRARPRASWLNESYTRVMGYVSNTCFRNVRIPEACA